MTKEEAFTEIFNLFYKHSKGIAMTIVNNEALAEDVCQEVFIEFLTKMDTLDYTNFEHVRGWLTICSDFRAKDWYRRMKRYDKIVNREVEYNQLHNVLNNVDSVEHIVLRKEECRYRAEVLNELKRKRPDDYHMLMKVHVDGETPESVADEYQISKGNLYTRIYRSRLWMRGEMSKKYKD